MMESHALVELPVSSLRHDRVVPAVNLRYVVPHHVLGVGHRQVPGKWNLQHKQRGIS